MSFVNASVSLTSSPSALFWLTVVLVILGLAAVIVPVIIYRRGGPRQRLLCSIISSSSLLTAPKHIREDLEIRYQKEPVENPWIVTLEILNTGRKAIEKESFTRGERNRQRGLRFDLAAPIITILPVEHKPSSAPKPRIIPTAGGLELRPELIVTKETITVPLLTKGPIGDITLSLNPFAEVTVDIRDREVWQRQRSRRTQLLSVAISAIAVILAVLATVSAFIEVISAKFM